MNVSLYSYLLLLLFVKKDNWSLIFIFVIYINTSEIVYFHYAFVEVIKHFFYHYSYTRNIYFVCIAMRFRGIHVTLSDLYHTNQVFIFLHIEIAFSSNQLLNIFYLHMIFVSETMTIILGSISFLSIKSILFKE